MKEISWNDLMKVELRVGRMLQAEVFQEARKPAGKQGSSAVALGTRLL